ncbi:NAD(P)-binding Rossmann-fold superfamily protein [Striga asiatica]|uniref:NAD(P)-binding Rossmann-fold superfamily protein n=1 Tax=Striga asiatica TaxID=4170 RepID=A0A5A7REQ8_STRAF|nr:NAD(P)-binding Rossmann-fold superfamily protein [Striga asiatica]
MIGSDTSTTRLSPDSTRVTPFQPNRLAGKGPALVSVWSSSPAASGDSSTLCATAAGGSSSLLVVLDSLDTSSSAGFAANYGWSRPVASGGSPALAAFGRRSRTAAVRVPEVNRAQTSRRTGRRTELACRTGNSSEPGGPQHGLLVSRVGGFSIGAGSARRRVGCERSEAPCQWRTSAVPLDRVSTVDGIEDDDGCFCEFAKEYKGRSDQKPRSRILGKFRREGMEEPDSKQIGRRGRCWWRIDGREKRDSST